MSRQSGRIRRLEQRVDRLGFNGGMVEVPEPTVGPGEESRSAAATNPWGSEWVQVRELTLRHMNRWVCIPGSATLEDEPTRTAIIGVLVGIRPPTAAPNGSIAAARVVGGRALIIRAGNQQTAITVPYAERIEVGDPA